MQPKNENGNLVRGLIVGVGIFFTVSTIFLAGVFVGEQKARFSFRWGQQYHRQFGGPPMGFGRPMGFFGGHGAAGVVIDNKDGKLWVRTQDNAEKVIATDKNTHIVKGRSRVKLKEIKEGERIVVVGRPDDKGRIKARLIRVFDPPIRKESMWRRGTLKPPPLPL